MTFPVLPSDNEKRNADSENGSDTDASHPPFGSEDDRTGSRGEREDNADDTEQTIPAYPVGNISGQVHQYPEYPFMGLEPVDRFEELERVGHCTASRSTLIDWYTEYSRLDTTSGRNR